MWFAMALIEVKTNIQNREIVDEPQTNDTYKIRQIITEIMKYIHICIHLKTKSKLEKKNAIDSPGEQRKGKMISTS